MKKFLSILLCILMLGSFIFAQEESVLADGLKVKAKGSAKLTWGIDLGKGTKKGFGEPAYPTHGFYNQTNLKLYIPFFGDEQALAGGSTNKEADVYADVKFNVTPGDMFVHKHDVDGKETKKDGFADTAPGYDVSAKLVFFGAYLQVYGKPGFSANYAIGWAPIKTKKWKSRNHHWFKPSFDGWGTKIGYANKNVMDLDVGLKLGSNRTWMRENDQFADGIKRDEKTVESLYSIGFDFHMMPVEKYLTIDATVNSTFHEPTRYMSGKPQGGGKEGKSPHTNFGLKLGSEPIDKLKIGLGFDGLIGNYYTDRERKDGGNFGWDLGFTVAYNWVDFALYVCGPGTDKKGYDFKSDKPWDNGANMAAHLGFKSEESGDTNFVEGLAFHLTLNAYDLLTKRAKDDKRLEISAITVAMKALEDAQKEYDEAFEAWRKTSGNEDKTEDDFKATSPQELIDLENAKAAPGAVGDYAKLAKGGTVPLGLNVGLSYKANITDSMWIKPFFEFYGETNHYGNETDKKIEKLYFGVAYEAGLTFSPVEKAEITAKWAHGKLNTNKYEGGWGGEYMIAAPANNKCHNGTFTLGCELKF